MAVSNSYSRRALGVAFFCLCCYRRASWILFELSERHNLIPFINFQRSWLIFPSNTEVHCRRYSIYNTENLMNFQSVKISVAFLFSVLSPNMLACVGKSKLYELKWISCLPYLSTKYQRHDLLKVNFSFIKFFLLWIQN